MMLSAASSGVFAAAKLANVLVQRQRLQQWPGIQWKLQQGTALWSLLRGPCHITSVTLRHIAPLLCSDRTNRV